MHTEPIDEGQFIDALTGGRSPSVAAVSRSEIGGFAADLDYGGARYNLAQNLEDGTYDFHAGHIVQHEPGGPNGRVVATITNAVGEKITVIVE